MRNGLLGSIAALAAGAGLAFGQAPITPRTQPTEPISGSAVAATYSGGTASSPYEPLAVSPAAQPPYGSPALDMFGPDGPGNGNGQRNCIRAWVDGDLLVWSVRNGPSHFPLIVTGTIANGAVPGTPGSITDFGGADIYFGIFAGARFSAGALFPGSDRIGVEAEGLILPKRTVTVAAASSPLGFPVIGRPFINELTGLPDAVPASSPANPGSASGEADTMFWSAEINLYANLYRGNYFTLNVISGFKHTNLAEQILARMDRTIGSAGQTFLGRPLPQGAHVAMVDDFQTTSHFYGWNFGLDWEYRYRCWFWDVGIHNAIGVSRDTVNVGGFSSSTSNTPNQVQGGLLAGITNLGRRVSDGFCDVPDIRTQIGYQLTSHIRFAVGYSLVYVSNVARPGDQIDPVVNPTLVPLRPEFALPLGTSRPMQLLAHSDYLAHGVNFSLAFVY
jgi:hypothetical protein